MALIDMRGMTALDDLSDIRDIPVTLLGSVQMLVAVHGLLAGAETDAATRLAEAEPGSECARSEAIALSLYGQLRESVETDPRVAAEIEERLGAAEVPVLTQAEQQEQKGLEPPAGGAAETEQPKKRRQATGGAA